jgi:uncharacterized protein (TIGR02145 family)
MRKLILTTAAVAAAIGLAGCGSGTLIDERDRQKYRTVVIGGDRWMAQNLNYKTDSSWCYENNTDSCTKYGRLYDWKTAKTVCPKGWKLPDTVNWRKLVTTAGDEMTAGRKLKAKNRWNKNGNGTDDFGFSAMPGGYRSTNGGDSYKIICLDVCEGFDDVGYYGYWWTATENWIDFAYYRRMNNVNDDVYEHYDIKGIGYSVRCVADTP